MTIQRHRRQVTNLARLLMILPHCSVNLQGHDCLVALALKRRATCAFAKSFLNLINNFVTFIREVQVNSRISEMAGN